MATIDQLGVLDLECVVVLAETLNFTQTAECLHMTQPGVTTHINKVEKRRGYRLFDRSKGVVRAITPKGFVFVEEARQVIEDVERLIMRSDEAHRAFSERLAISPPYHGSETVHRRCNCSSVRAHEYLICTHMQL